MNLCLFVYGVYVWLCKEEKEKKELEKNWGCDGHKFHVCGGSLQKLNSTRFLFDRNDFVAKKRTIHFPMHADLG